MTITVQRCNDAHLYSVTAVTLCKILNPIQQIGNVVYRKFVRFCQFVIVVTKTLY